MRSFNAAESNARASSSAKRSTLHALRASSDAPRSPLNHVAPLRGKWPLGCRRGAPRSSGASRSTLHAPRAFTLLELLVVMVVMVVILTMSLPAFINIGRGMSLRAAVNNVSATLALSRQWAITHREQITFVGSATGLTYNAATGQITPATNDHACFYVIGAATNVIQAVTDLPLDITFDASSETNLTFKTDGSLGNPTTFSVILADKRNPSVTKTIAINGLTGGIRVE